METYGAINIREASLNFVDLLPLAENIETDKLFVAFCVLSHDLGFENGSVISLTRDARKRCDHCNQYGFQSRLHRMTF